MPAGRMHADEVETDVPLVRRLLAVQFPQWSDLPIEPVRSDGTDNALYRLGDDMVARLPLIHWAVGQVEKDHRWLPTLAPHVPLAIPVPLARGMPGEGYPWPWSVRRWLPGENATLDRLADPRQAARQLAEFITALQQIDPTGGPAPGDLGRGVPLARRDEYTRTAIASCGTLIDADAVTAAWEADLNAPAWDRPSVWVHGDLGAQGAGNLLAVEGRLSAVIDFGTLGVGDPACELIVAWSLFEGGARDAFRAALSVDDATWARGRGWALYRITRTSIRSSPPARAT